MTDLVFFYGTLMSGFKRPRSRAGRREARRRRAADRFAPTLFDLGIYPAATPGVGRPTCWGEVHRMLDADAVLTALDEIEGFRPGEPDASLYTRVETPVTFDDGHVERRRGSTSTTRRSARRSGSSQATTSSISR